MSNRPRALLGARGLQNSDSPIKPSASLGTMYGEDAKKIANDVKSALKGRVRIVSAEAFRTTLLPIAIDPGSQLDDALRKVKKNFHSGKRWHVFPNPPKGECASEDEYYAPFTQIAQAVNDACRLHAPTGCTRVWVDRHSTAPETHSADCPQIRPDIVQVSELTSRQFENLDVELRKGKSPAEEKDPHEKNLKVWWMQIHTIVEVKSKAKNSQDLHDAIIQLCTYIRQVLCEQLDRRFVIAMLFCGGELTLWYCDRVALIGAIKPINIHKNPDAFINILAAFSLLPAEKLGWDPTMKLLQRNDNGILELIPSYLVFPSEHQGLYKLNWCISMPSKDRIRREDFVTIRAMIASPSQIFGRSTIVWETVRKKDFEKGDFNNPQTPVFILKQTWQPMDDDAYDGVCEARMYGQAHMDHERIYSYETVKTTDGEAVSTQSIRRGLQTEVYQEDGQKPDDGRVRGKRKLSAVVRSEEEQPFAYIRLMDVSDSIFQVNNAENHELYPRALVRLLMKKRGYPLRYFVDLLELVTAIRDAVQDHEKFYDSGVLHRDVSLGNILICETYLDDAGRRDGGMLIDLDHAKVTDDQVIHTGCKIPSDKSIRYLDVSLEPYILEGCRISDGIQQKALQVYNDHAHISLPYLSNLLENLPDSVKKYQTVWDEDTLGWPRELKLKYPDFRNHKARQGLVITGTIPFVSVELLRRNSFQENKSRLTHSVIHDMESFFWVLVYICLTRKANEGCRRPELNSPHTELTRLSKNLFEGDDAWSLRWGCLSIESEFRDNILESIEPYFKCLEDLLLQWRRVLMLAHKFDGIEYYNIHQVMLIILDKTIKGLERLQGEDPEYDEGLFMKVKNERCQKMWNAWRSKPEALTDGEQDVPHKLPSLGGYSPLAREKTAVRFTASVSPPPSPSPAPRPKRQKNGKGKDKEETRVEGKITGGFLSYSPIRRATRSSTKSSTSRVALPVPSPPVSRRKKHKKVTIEGTN